MRLLLCLLRLAFSLLYHQFAWAYDLVSAAVSLGRWKGWVMTVLPHLDGRVLELGFGPGHLQAALHEKGIRAFGLDESRQMLRLAGRRLGSRGIPVRLSRGHAQRLPFPAEAFDRVAATFPSEYIFESQTLEEVYRVLVPGGRLVLAPTAWIRGNKSVERFAAWLLRLSGQTGAARALQPMVAIRFARAGLEARSQIAEAPGGQVLVVIAEKK
jgi:ubiquinone/menaquinone biosynthesis C-methylase UbiE